MPTVAATLGVSPTSVYGWLKILLVQGVAGLRVQWRGGRPSKLTQTPDPEAALGRGGQGGTSGGRLSDGLLERLPDSGGDLSRVRRRVQRPLSG